MQRTRLTASVCTCWTLFVMLSLAGGLPASAQGEGAEGEGAGQEPAPSSEAATEAAQDGLETIVTVTRREEFIQQVPVSVNAYSGTLLEDTNVQTLDDLSQIAPGASFISISGNSGSFVQLRGSIGGDDSPAFDTPVAVFIDELYYGSLSGFYPDFFDVEQIAVLRGPQGTGFGRNVVGGAIQITSRKPDFDGTYGSASVTVRNRPGIQSTGFINVPISDKFSTRLAYSFINVDGYSKNLITGRDLDDVGVWSVRLSTRYRPSDNLDINFSASWTHEDALGAGYRLTGDGMRVAFLEDNTSGIREVLQDQDGSKNRDIWNVVLRADWDLSLGTLTSITGYRGLDQFYHEDVDGGKEDFNPNKFDLSNEDQFSQELRLTSLSGQSLEWIAGIYYLNQELFRSETHNFGGPPGSLIAFLIGGSDGLANGARQSVEQNQTTRLNSFSAFAEATYHMTEWIAATAGVRYTYDRKKGNTFHSAPSRFFGDQFDLDWRQSWDNVTPRFVIEVTPNDDVLLYASATKGFKSGGFSFSAPTVDEALLALRPESAWSYEAGLKSEWFDSRLLLNLTGFFMETKNLQLRTLQDGVLRQSNAGKVETKGIEAELTARPTEDFLLGLNYTYTDAKYESFPGCTAGGADCTGNRVQFVPAHTLSVFLEYTWQLPDWGTLLTFRSEYNYRDKYNLTATNDLPDDLVRQTRRDGFVNLFLTLESEDSDWELSFWARNIANDEAVNFATNFFFFHLDFTEFLGGASNVYRTNYTEPRSFGVTFKYRFQ